MFNAKKLAEYLERNNISQARFGEMIGVSGTMVFYLIKGFKQPSIPLLKRIASELGCTVDELLSDTAEQQTM